jgi:hypothetical protein
MFSHFPLATVLGHSLCYKDWRRLDRGGVHAGGSSRLDRGHVRPSRASGSRGATWDQAAHTGYAGARSWARRRCGWVVVGWVQVMDLSLSPEVMNSGTIYI